MKRSTAQSSIPYDEMVAQTLDNKLSNMSRADMEATLTPAMSEQMGMDSETVQNRIELGRFQK